MSKEQRFRVVGKDYIVFADGTRVDKGKLVPKDIDCTSLPDGWVEEA